MPSEISSILFLTKYSRMGASSRYRSWQYLPALEAKGIRCDVSPLFNDNYLKHLYSYGRVTIADLTGALKRRLEALLKVVKYDLLWLEYELFPYLPAIFEEIIAAIAIPYVVDYDDALFHQYDCHRNLWVRQILGTKIAVVMRNSRLVIAGNNYLADYARKAGANQVDIVPTVVDLSRYLLKANSSDSELLAPDLHLPVKRTSRLLYRGDNTTGETPALTNYCDRSELARTAPVAPSIFTIGWIGSPSTSKYLQEIAPALAEVCRNGRGRVALIGAGEVDLPGVPVVRLPWSEDTEVANMQKFDVGIMPLVDRPWERGKCGFKLIQYMACSLPVVASPVGVNSEIVEPDVNGFLAITTRDWVRTLTELRDRPDLRDKMGRAGRKKVESRYCLQVTAPRLVSILQGAIKDIVYE